MHPEISLFMLLEIRGKFVMREFRYLLILNNDMLEHSSDVFRHYLVYI